MSSVVRSAPQKASSVHSHSTVPGRTLRTAGTPPNVNAYCSGSGRNSTISIGASPPMPTLEREAGLQEDLPSVRAWGGDRGGGVLAALRLAQGHDAPRALLDARFGVPVFPAGVLHFFRPQGAVAAQRALA